SRPEKILVEHTSINPNKAAHIGHLRTPFSAILLYACCAPPELMLTSKTTLTTRAFKWPTWLWDSSTWKRKPKMKSKT
ncbi:MAG TPA: hypothetical protein VJA94_07380, partial [Candidatus Angelobacter sp.]